MNWWQVKVIQPLQKLLLQGASPDAVAWSLAVGIVVGLFPVPGTTTALCAAIALLFHLNPVAIQLANWLVYPLQLLLIIPFWRAGDQLFGYPPIELTAEGLQAWVALNWQDALSKLGWTALRGIAVWALCSVVLAFCLQRLFRLPLRKMLAKKLPS